MKATFEEGSEIVVDSETVALNPTWTEAPEKGCDLWRRGDQVTLALRVKNANAKAWKKQKYKEGELAVEGGKVYKAEGAGLVAKETDENKPSTKPTMWVVVGETALIATLPEEYRPAIALIDASGKLEVKANGEVVSLESAEELETVQTLRYGITFRAAEIVP
jgi:hypothetical protein